MSDFRQKQELEEARMQANLAVLLRVKQDSGDGIASYLALELGLLNEYRQFTNERKVA